MLEYISKVLKHLPSMYKDPGLNPEPCKVFYSVFSFGKLGSVTTGFNPLNHLVFYSQ
jgi:hypothetical protein